jgi:circadian clock protein KaiC
MTDRVKIETLSTGIPGLDAVLGGGMPEFSFNLIAGGAGCGKTTMAHQFVFANASAERKALYFTIYGEPPIKMLRYQQQFSFFDSSKVNNGIRFIHLGKEMVEGGLTKVLERIKRELETADARTVVVDSFRSVARLSNVGEESGELERFVQLLALTLTSYEATTFLIGEYMEDETSINPVFTVADGIVWLYQDIVRNSVIRRLQVVKLRGQAQIPGLHSFKLTDNGARVFPRSSNLGVLDRAPYVGSSRTAAPLLPDKQTGIRELDEMLGGGIPTGSSILVAGPSGSGKTTLATEFVTEGIARGEPAIVAIFETTPEEYLRTNPRARMLDGLIQDDKLGLIYIRPLDLSVDETVAELLEAVERLKAKRLVIDSLSGFELALAPVFRDDFRESFYRMFATLRGLGVTVMATVEVVDSFSELRLSPHGTSFLSDGIILQRYVEMDGSVRKVMTVIKMRGRPHSRELREYDVNEAGIVIGRPLTGQRGVFTGAPQPIATAEARKAKPKPKPKLKAKRVQPPTKKRRR